MVLLIILMLLSGCCGYMSGFDDAWNPDRPHHWSEHGFNWLSRMEGYDKAHGHR